MSTTEIPQQDTNLYQNKVNPIPEKTQHQQGMITPPMSPVNHQQQGGPSKKGSMKITAGQTGLPWLSHDADGEGFSAAAPSPDSPRGGAASPPPKFMARPRTASVIRFPTRKRTMQKHIYTMRDGLDPVKVLCNRLSSWQISVNYLLKMFASIKKVETTTGKGYRKIDSKFTIPVKIKDQFKSSHGVQDAWAAFRQYTRENSLIHQDFVDFIENEIVPTLHIMLKDIHSMMHSLKQNKNLRTNTLWECRKHADKVITRLNTDIYKTVDAQEKAKSSYVMRKRDPLLSKYVVIHTIRDLYKHENRLHKDFLTTQDEYRQFEQNKIISVYTELFQTFETYRMEHKLENLEGVAKVANILNAIETDAEWLDFVQHHDNELVKPTAAFKDEQSLDFPNASHPLVQPLIMSVLQRHHGRKWHQEYYVLTPVGLLHRFKSEKNLLEHPLRPEATMFVPQCTLLINNTSQLLQLKGKFMGSLFGSQKTVELSSSDSTLIKEWINILGPMAHQQETAVINTPLPEQISPPAMQDTRSIHSKVQDEEVPASNPNNTRDIHEPITENTHFQPITNIATSNIHDTADDDDDRDFARQTVEYSTHSPITEHGDNYYNNQPTSASSTEPNTATGPPTPTAAGAPPIMHHQDVHTPLAFNNHNNNAKAPPGPTREGSDLFWESTA